MSSTCYEVNDEINQTQGSVPFVKALDRKFEYAIVSKFHNDTTLFKKLTVLAIPLVMLLYA